MRLLTLSRLQDMLLDVTKQIGSSNYLLSSDAISANTTRQFWSSEFRYRMHVHAPTGATMRAQIAFDFVANDFRLELIDRDSCVWRRRWARVRCRLISIRCAGKICCRAATVSSAPIVRATPTFATCSSST